MAKLLIVNPNNAEFRNLMVRLARAIRNKDTQDLAQIKIDFSEYDTSILYNASRDEIRVIVKDCPFVDFPVSKFVQVGL